MADIYQQLNGVLSYVATDFSHKEFSADDIFHVMKILVVTENHLQEILDKLVHDKHLKLREEYGGVALKNYEDFNKYGIIPEKKQMAVRITNQIYSITLEGKMFIADGGYKYQSSTQHTSSPTQHTTNIDRIIQLSDNAKLMVGGDFDQSYTSTQKQVQNDLPKESTKKPHKAELWYWMAGIGLFILTLITLIYSIFIKK